MKADAESHAEDDRKRRELIDVRNKGDQMAYQVEKTLKEAGDKVDAAARGEVESAVSNLKETLKGEDAAAINKAIENLEQASHKIAQAMYDQSAAQQGEAGAPTGAPQDQPKDDGDDVIDAEYEVKE